MNTNLFEKLCSEHPDAYIKIGADKFFPVRTELLDFPLIATIIRNFKDDTFPLEKYQSLPVVFTIEPSEEKTFLLYYYHNMLGLEIKLSESSEQEQYNFFVLLSYISGDPQYMSKFLISCKIDLRKINTKVWIKLSKSGISSRFLKFEQRYDICRDILKLYLDKKPVKLLPIKGIGHKEFIDRKYVEKLVRICDFYGIILVEMVNFDPTRAICVEYRNLKRYTIETHKRDKSIYFLCKYMQEYDYPGAKKEHVKDATLPLYPSHKIDVSSKIYLPSFLSKKTKEDYKIVIDTSDKNPKYHCGYCQCYLHYHPHGN